MKTYIFRQQRTTSGVSVAPRYTCQELSPVHTCNNVEATIDFVERIVRLVTFDNVAGVDVVLLI